MLYAFIKFITTSKEIEKVLFKELAHVIAQGKQQLVAQVNSVLTITYWHVGKKINDYILKNKRAKYGKQVVVIVAAKLESTYGKQFAEKKLRRFMRFA